MISFAHEALPGRVVFGAGTSRDRLPEEVDQLGASRILLIATERERDRAKDLAETLGDRLAATFTGVRQHVPVEVADEARKAARDAVADGLLCVGGGSAIGTAKAVALETALPMVAVPTTYSGSEMTPIYGLTEAQRKQTGRSLAVLPRVVVYDPELTFSLPASVTAPSAMNAMAHCVEAFYATTSSPISSLLAEEGIRALARGVPVAVEKPDDLEGRSETLYGAYLAGAAFATAGSGLHHKICHVLGGALDLPHAETHSVVLPHVTAFNEGAVPGTMARIASALGTKSAATGLYDLAASLGIPMSLEALGMKEEDIEGIVPEILEGAPLDNPRPVDETGVNGILEGALRGRRPGAENA